MRELTSRQVTACMPSIYSMILAQLTASLLRGQYSGCQRRPKLEPRSNPSRSCKGAETEPVAAQHDRHLPNAQALLADTLSPPHVLDVHGDSGRVRHVTQPTLLGCDGLVDVVLCHAGLANMDVMIPGSQASSSCYKKGQRCASSTDNSKLSIASPSASRSATAGKRYGCSACQTSFERQIGGQIEMLRNFCGLLLQHNPQHSLPAQSLRRWNAYTIRLEKILDAKPLLLSAA